MAGSSMESATTATPHAGQVALIAGASRGIGLATALRLESLGATIVSVQRSEGPGLWIPADLGNAEQAESAVALAVKRTGRLDICVYAAGVNHRQDALDISVADWQRVIDVNLTSAFVVTRGAARQFRSQGGGGCIVHVASELSFFGGLGVMPYSVSKGGVVQLVKSQSN